MNAVPELTYRTCDSVDEYQQCVELQRTVWGFDDVDVLPTRLFVVARKIGGQIFGAFEPGGCLAGFLLALPGVRPTSRGEVHPYFHSHMLGVFDEYRDRGVGRKLKLMQRDDALARGVRLVEWTFDPLEPKNAFFNLERLGAIVRRYVPNHYGTTTSELHAGLPTDRLVAEWWLDAPRVEQVLGGEAGCPRPEARLEVPPGIAATKRDNRQHALAVQQRLREGFQQAFAAGLTLTGFDRAGAYLLDRYQPPSFD